MVVREKYRGYSAAGISWYSATVDLHNNNNNNNNILNHVNRPVQRYLCTGRPGHCAAKRRGRASTIII